MKQNIKKLTSFEGLKESFDKAVMLRMLPGWDWLRVRESLTREDLVITQTNNEDNPIWEMYETNELMGVYLLVARYYHSPACCWLVCLS